MIRFYCDICCKRIEDPNFLADKPKNFVVKPPNGRSPRHVQMPERMLLCVDCIDVVFDALERIKAAETNADE